MLTEAKRSSRAYDVEKIRKYDVWRDEGEPGARRLKELERENGRLKRAVADLTLDKLILEEAARGNF